ncbi:MAG: hypothetical protein U0835_04860 [Isosphaeraceae bacterium]
MGFPSVRLTVRRSMALTGCVALVCGLAVESGRRRDEAHRAARQHRDLGNLCYAAAGYPRLFDHVDPAGLEVLQAEFQRFLHQTRRGHIYQVAQYHHDLCLKYGAASGRLWPRISPGPPPYRFTSEELEEEVRQRSREQEAEAAVVRRRGSDFWTRYAAERRSRSGAGDEARSK